jgi:hypothetical protein
MSARARIAELTQNTQFAIEIRTAQASSCEPKNADLGLARPELHPAAAPTTGAIETIRQG